MSAARLSALTSPNIPLGYWVEDFDGKTVKGEPKPYFWTPRDEKSLILCAPAGSGKFTTQIAPTLLSMNYGSIIINDPKGEACAVTGDFRRSIGNKVIVLNPFGVLPHLPGLAGNSFNPLADLDPASDSYSSEIETLVDAIILPSGDQSHFYEGARRIVSGIIEHLRHACPAGRLPTLVDLNNAVNAPPDKFNALMVSMQASPFDTAAHVGALYGAKRPPRSSGEQLEDARTQLSRFLGAKPIQRALSGSDFKWSDVKAGNHVVYIVMPEAEAKTYFRFTRLLYASAMKAMLRTPNTPVLFILDELATSLGMKQMEIIETAFSLGRGYGLRLQAIFQSWPQVEKLFGDLSDALFSSSGIVQLFRPNDRQTVKLMEERGGAYSLVYRARSDSLRQDDPASPWQQTVSLGTHTETLPRLGPDILYGLPGDMQIIFQEGVATPDFRHEAALLSR